MTAPTVARPRTHFHPLRVESVDPLTDDSVAITFAVPPELREEFRFRHGQHLAVRWSAPDGSEVRRNYSVCSSAVDGPLRIGVKRIDGGAFSTYATTSLRPGDVLDVLPPSGRFTTELDPTARRHYAAVAAGSGITPILSIVATVLAVEPESTVTLLYGNRSAQTVMFLEELQDLKNQHPARLNVVHVLSREASDLELLHGRIERGKLAQLLDLLLPADSVDEWFLCGPLEMVEASRAELLERGVDPEHVHAELFHVEAEPPRRAAVTTTGSPSAGSEVTVVLDGRATTLAVSRDERILDAVLRVRADAPYACKGGVCGTCRARVTEGEVEMDRNYALEKRDLDAGFVLACQARPASGLVRLDFDS